MPELPEVETIARQLSAALTGRVFGPIRHLRGDMVRGADHSIERCLPGMRVLGARRRAKRVILELRAERRGLAKQATPSDAHLVIHLGMTGRLLVCAAAQPIEPHTHLRVALEASDDELRFRDPRRFGGIWLMSEEVSARPPQGRALGSLGPEPLELKLVEFSPLLRRKRAIKSLLLDQTAIAGLGNIYCDESLFAARIHPLRRADSLSEDECKRLLRAIKATLRRAIKFNGSTLMDYRTTDGEPGSFQRYHKVYDRAGEPCRVCGTAIVRIIVAGRSSALCPSCQPRARSRPPSKRPARRKVGPR
jgi:formamidopyrimidine-DNA glycosylase